MHPGSLAHQKLRIRGKRKRKRIWKTYYTSQSLLDHGLTIISVVLKYLMPESLPEEKVENWQVEKAELKNTHRHRKHTMIITLEALDINCYLMQTTVKVN